MTTDFSREQIAPLENLLDYRFKNLDLIHEALSHPSLKQRRSNWQKNYERLEILGDAILGFLITEILFNKYKESSEGNIARLKSYLVSREIISQVAGQIRLADFIIMTKGEEESGGRTNPGNAENTLEALIAAIYLDSNMDNTKILVARLWSGFLVNIDLSQIDPKTSLQEWAQAHNYGIPQYKMVDKAGPAHAPYYTVSLAVGKHIATGHGSAIKDAEKDAAKKLLDHLHLAKKS